MKKIILILLVVFVSFSCSLFQKDKDEIRKEKQEKYFKFIDSIKANENVRYFLDTLSYKYSIDFKDDFFKNNLLINYFQIIDIYKKNDQYHIKTKAYLRNSNLYLDLKTNAQTALSIRKEIDFNDDDIGFYEFDLYVGHPRNKFLIIKIDTLRKINVKIGTYLSDYEVYEYDDNQYDIDDYSIELEENVSNSFIGKGTVIKYIKNNDYETN